MKIKKKLALAISGGIDSSIACFLLYKDFFYLENFFIKNWDSDKKNTCNSKLDLFYIKKICLDLNVNLHVLNYNKIYLDSIFKYFVNGLKKGLTPNPDVICNKKFKFKIMLYYIIFILKFDFLITGHYSCINFYNKKFFLYKNFDIKKDQNYFLFKINNFFRKKIVFVLSNYSKSNIRLIVKKIKFINFNKKSSTGICFIGENNFQKFIINYIKKINGIIMDENNIILGEHNGVFLYTLGQKTTINNKNNSTFYVFKKNYKKNILYVTKNKKNLFFNKFFITNVFNSKIKKQLVLSKIRHSSSYSLSLLYINEKKIYIYFKKKEYIIASGQYIVFYKNNFCLGGARVF